MSNGVSLITALVSSLIISSIVSAGVLFVAIPMVYPSTDDSSFLKIAQIESIEVDNEILISDQDVVFQKMNETEMIFTIKSQSSILAQFVGDLRTSIYFSSYWVFEIALVVQGVGNQTAAIVKTGVDSINQYDTHNIVINYLTPSLPAGNYTVGVYWRSTYNASGGAYLGTYYFDQDLVYSNTTRTLTLWEIAQ